MTGTYRVRTAASIGLVIVLTAIGIVWASAKDAVTLGAGVAVTGPSLGDFITTWGHADPDNPNHLIACGESDNSDNNHFSFVFASNDGGRTWRQTLADRSSRWVSEDSCAYGNDGRSYFATGSSYVHNGIPHHEYGSLHVYRSDDYGMTWKGPAVRGFVDWTSIAVDQTQGPRRGYVYLFGNATSVHRGKWWPFRPVLYTSRDGGVTFAGPVSVHPKGYSYHSAFAGGSIVLSNETAIVADAVQRMGGTVAGTLGLHSTIEVFASSDGGRTLKRGAVLTDVHGASAWPSAPAQDQSDGPYRNRIYIAWNEIRTSGTRLMLAYSDDAGRHWKTREIMRGAPDGVEAACDEERSAPDLGIPKIAVNKYGILGLAWAEDMGHRMWFVSSIDGGRTFSRRIQLAACMKSDERYPYLEAVPFSENWYAEVLAVTHNKPEPTPDFNSLGISLRIFGDIADSPELAADANGIFHAFWAEPGDGLSMWARAIDVPGSQLTSDPPAARPPLVDVSSALSFDFTHLAYDPATRIIFADVRVINKGRRWIFAPLLLEGYGMLSNYGRAVPVNETRRASNGDPVWDVSNSIPVAGLAPGDEGSAYHFVFRIEHYHHVSQGDAVSLKIRAYARVGRMTVR